MRNGMIWLCCWLLAASASAETLLGSTNIEITGEIFARTCDIAEGESNKVVDLKEHDRRLFDHVGAVSDSQPFTITLENCVLNPKTSNDVYMTFSGQPANGSPELLALTNAGNSGVAGGVAVEILNASKQRIALNSEQAYPITDGTNDFVFNLRYYAISSPVSAGDANATLYIDLRYE